MAGTGRAYGSSASGKSSEVTLRRRVWTVGLMSAALSQHVARVGPLRRNCLRFLKGLRRLEVECLAGTVIAYVQTVVLQLDVIDPLKARRCSCPEQKKTRLNRRPRW